MRRRVAVLGSVAALVALTGCEPDRGEDSAPPPRPVLSIVVKPAGDRQIGFAGTIQPRYQTDRGFRVLGRIVARNVDVGDLVKAGQKLAENDPLPYQLAVRSSEAALENAKSQLAKTLAARQRTATLVGEKISSQADLDAAEQAVEAASASAQQAEATLAKSREQLGYTVLTADADGVVTSVDAQVGQMASPGAKVMTIARTDVREAVVDLPDDVVRRLGVGAPFQIFLQADMAIAATGKTREIAPQADAATRTRRVRITLDRTVDAFRLGATITVRPEAPVGPAALEVPVTALLERDGATQVWVVDPATTTVRTVAVEAPQRRDGMARIDKGLAPGVRVVVAGVHSLKEGQTVKIDGGAEK